LKLVLFTFIIEAFREVLPPAGKKVRLGPLCPGVVLDLKVEFREELGPAGLLAIKLLRGHEVFQVVVV
jgi:hypothetical protein